MTILDNVSKYYQTRGKTRFAAAESTSLEIQNGEIFGPVGCPGAGKSTLLRLINLLKRPDSGKVNVYGQELATLDVAALCQVRQNIGMVFQQFNLLSDRIVADNVIFPLEITGWSSEKIKEHVKEYLEVVGLTERADYYPAQPSDGQKQRVGITHTLAPKPQITLADRPTSVLDPVTTHSVSECLEDINKRFNVTIVIVTHGMSITRRLYDHAAFSDKGKVAKIVEVRGNQTHVQSEIGRELVQEG